METPDGWTVVTDETRAEREGLIMSGPDGWELRVHRVAGLHSLLQLGQLRLDELGGVVPGIQDISVSVETAAVGEAMLLVYEHASLPEGSWSTWLCVRPWVKRDSVTS